MKMPRDSRGILPAPVGRSLAPVAAGHRDQARHFLQRAFVAVASHDRRGHELAAHGEGRRAFDAIGVGQLVGALHLGLDAERIEHGIELGAVHALRGGPFAHGLLVDQALVLAMDGGEDLGVQVGALQRDQREVQLLQRLHAGVEGDRHLLEHHVGRGGLGPVFDQRFHGGAVRAGVGEEFQHFDLARVSDGSGGLIAWYCWAPPWAWLAGLRKAVAVRAAAAIRRMSFGTAWV